MRFFGGLSAEETRRPWGFPRGRSCGTGGWRRPGWRARWTRRDVRSGDAMLVTARDQLGWSRERVLAASIAFRSALVEVPVMRFCLILDEGSDPLTFARDRRRHTHPDHGSSGEIRSDLTLWKRRAAEADVGDGSPNVRRRLTASHQERDRVAAITGGRGVQARVRSRRAPSDVRA